MILHALILAAAASIPADDAALLSHLTASVAAAYDTSRGGFVTKNGLPSESAVDLAFRLGQAEPTGPWTDRAVTTVHWVHGLLDTVGGGFMHSAKDVDPNLAHFEKRTDSNARRLEMLVRSWTVTGDETYRRDAARVVDFFERVLLDGRGGFVDGQVGDRELVPYSNGLAIHAWLSWASANRDPRYRDFALKSLDRVWETCSHEEVGLLRRGPFGEVLALPQLVDQSEMGRAYVLAAHLVGRTKDRERAVWLGDMLLKKYQDAEKGGFRTQAAPAKDGKIKRAARVPDENARAALFLCELSVLTGREEYRAAAQRAWRAFPKEFEKLGLDAADWALAVQMAVAPGLPEKPEWQVAAEQEDTKPKKSFRIRVRK